MYFYRLVKHTAKITKKGSLIGGVGALLIGAAMLLFVATIILNALRDNGGSAAASLNEDGNGIAGTAGFDARARWNATNVTIATLTNFLTIGVYFINRLCLPFSEYYSWDFLKY